MSDPDVELARARRARARFWAAARALRRAELASVAGRASLGLGLLFGSYAAVWAALGGAFERRALREAGVLVGLAATAPLALRAARGTGMALARAEGVEAAAAAAGTRGWGFAQAGYFGSLGAMTVAVGVALVPFVVVVGAAGVATPARAALLLVLCAPFAFVVAGLATSLAAAARLGAHPRGGLALVTLFLASVVAAGLGGAPALAVPGLLRAAWRLTVALALGGAP